MLLGEGLFLVMCGLIKKVVISDYISVNFVDRIFDNPMLYTGFENLMGVYGYTLQIYCDFSGYSDMAIGIALLMGYRFKINFDSPYKSGSITEFWRRWHISLSSWLRDYLYISLGGNRRGKIRTYFNLFITMVLGGLWHGASWLFVIWGAWHGVLLIVHKVYRRIFPVAKDDRPGIIRHFFMFCSRSMLWPPAGYSFGHLLLMLPDRYLPRYSPTSVPKPFPPSYRDTPLYSWL